MGHLGSIRATKTSTTATQKYALMIFPLLLPVGVSGTSTDPYRDGNEHIVRETCDPELAAGCDFETEVRLDFDDEHSYLLKDRDVAKYIANVSVHWINTLYECVGQDDFFHTIDVTLATSWKGRGFCKGASCPAIPVVPTTNEDPTSNDDDDDVDPCTTSLLRFLQRLSAPYFADVVEANWTFVSDAATYSDKNDTVAPTFDLTLGDDPDTHNETEISFFGGRTSSVVVSGDANIAVVGGGYRRLQIYQRNSPDDDDWTLVHIVSDVMSGSWHLSVTADGSSFVAGSSCAQPVRLSSSCESVVRVFTYDEETFEWTMKGDRIEDSPLWQVFVNGRTNRFGSSVAISDDGDTVAVGDHGRNFVKVYEYDADAACWKKCRTLRYGLPFFDEGPQFGRSIALSSTGVTLMVGAPADKENNFNGARVGTVSVYDLSEECGRLLLQKIRGDDCEVRLGWAITMSKDAGRFAVVAEDSVTNDRGHVDVYEYTTSTQMYVRIGQRVYASEPKIVISADGNLLLVGSPSNDEINVNAGKAFLYDVQSEALILYKVLQANGEINNQFGLNCELSQDGSTVAVGAWGLFYIYDLL